MATRITSSNDWVREAIFGSEWHGTEACLFWKMYIDYKKNNSYIYLWFGLKDWHGREVCLFWKMYIDYKKNNSYIYLWFGLKDWHGREVCLFWKMYIDYKKIIVIYS